MAVRDDGPDGLTFSQQYGFAPLPDALQVGHLSEKFRLEIWRVIENHVASMQGIDVGHQFGVRFHETYLGKLHTTFCTKVLGVRHDSINFSMFPHGTAWANDLSIWLRGLIFESEHHETLSFLQYMFCIEGMPEHLATEIMDCFKFAPYIVNRSDTGASIVPVTSDEHRESMVNALSAINQSSFTDAKIHLAASAEALNNQQFSDSIRESVHAVEAAARDIAPDAKDKTLGAALQILKDRDIINHKMLKATFDKLYAYANDASGVRHSRKGGEPENVGIDEALFIYSACVSFVDYLVRKQSQLNNDA